MKDAIATTSSLQLQIEVVVSWSESREAQVPLHWNVILVMVLLPSPSLTGTDISQTYTFVVGGSQTYTFTVRIIHMRCFTHYINTKYYSAFIKILQFLKSVTSRDLDNATIFFRLGIIEEKKNNLLHYMNYVFQTLHLNHKFHSIPLYTPGSFLYL